MPYKEGKMWRAQVMHHGKRYSVLRATKRSAIAWEKEKREELQAQTSKRPSESMDLKSFVAKYLDYSERFAYKTYDEKRTMTRRILREWGPDCPVGEITPAMVLSYLNGRAKAQSANAYNKDRKNLHAMWGWGKKILKLEENPIAEIERRAWDRTPQYVPPTEDVLKVLATAMREERVFLYCYVLTGARRSEIFRWRWHDDINLEKRQYRLGTRKTRTGSMEYQWFDMPDELYEELWWWYNNRPLKRSPYVFVSTSNRHHGRPFTTRRRFMKGLCKRAGVDPFEFSALRSFFASVLADQMKQSTKTIQRLLRHKRVQTTEGYIRNINQDLKASVDGLASFLKNKLHEDLHEKEKEANEEDR